MSTLHTYFATVPLGLEQVLAEELLALGATEVKEGRAGVSFKGSLATGYRACFWLRTASRVLLQLASFPAPTPEALYDGARSLDWSEHLALERTFAVDFTSVRSQITHTNYGALKVKDAMVDQFRDRCGTRPSVDREQPNLRVNVHLHEDVASVSLNLSGESLHRRKWRRRGGAASLKENLAAGILLLAGWPETAASGGALVDPMCGAGTLPIEAALMAADVAPGLMRSGFGFQGWLGHDPAILARLKEEAAERDMRSKRKLPPIAGYDSSSGIVPIAGANAAQAGLGDTVQFERRELAMVEPLGTVPGLFVANPPYGERIGDSRTLRLLYKRLGMTLKQRFQRWTGYIFTGNRELAKQVGLRVEGRHILYNGTIECRLLKIPVLPPRQAEPAEAGGAGRTVEPAEAGAGSELGNVPAPMLANRLRKNLRKLRRWVKREQITCYRVYDADLPEYALSVDLYGNWVHVQENDRPDSVDPLKAETRLHDGLAAIRELFELSAQDVFVKHRGRQRGTSQYEKLGDEGEFREVSEGGFRFLVNPGDYFDTGLFLDHRPTRALIRELAKGRRFLNLFGYTGTASVYAAGGGAVSTTTIDLSRTYLDWAGKNMEINGFKGRSHIYMHEDVLQWLKGEKPRYGLIFLDPPTFSNSKSMRGTFEIQRDHVWLIKTATKLLQPGGILLFSNNFRRFKMDREALKELEIQDITRTTIPPDFERNPRIHNCWRITHKAG